MYNICVFAGTTEGRKLVEFLSMQSVSVMACVATKFGETLLSAADNLTVSAKRLTLDEMVQMFSQDKYDLVVDATHPYATVVTDNIAEACNRTNTKYLRLLRENSAVSADAVFVPDIPSAVEYLNTVEGNILLTTGSKELSGYVGISDFADRVYARVLPTESSLEACYNAGLAPANIIAMKGPFSEEMNVATLSCVSAKYLVTKDSGEMGGFDAKVISAKKAGAQLVVIGRPPQREGVSFAQTIEILCEQFGCVIRPRVTIVGIGPGNRDAMTEEVRQAITDADCLIGAKRMLDAVASSRQNVYTSIVPDKIAQYIASHPEYQHFTVAMSGDAGFFSGTKKLIPLLNTCKVTVLPGISSLSYLCARLQMSYEDMEVVSLHGRDNDIISNVRKNFRVFVLVGGENGMGNLCKTLVDAGLENVRMYIGENLSYPDEKIITGTAQTLADNVFAALSVAIIENSNPDAVVTPGLPDSVFQRGVSDDGIVPMTKSEVRAVCISKLRLTERSVCWDIGAGTGSVAIEMSLMARKGQVYAIERKEAAVSLLSENAEKTAGKNLTVVSGEAPEACKHLPMPTHVFIGGSSGNMKEIIAELLLKNPAVRIVATAISLETVAELVACIKEFDFKETEIVSLQVARGKEAGSYHLMNAQNPVYIFTMQYGGTKQ